MNHNVRKLFLTLSILGMLSLTACGSDNHSELKKYVKAVKHRPAPPIEPVPTVAVIPGHDYAGHGKRSPFHQYVSKRSVAQGPDQNREKEHLEAFPLDSLRMVGILEENNKTWAIITAPDGTVDKVTVGGYIGQNYGRVSEISSKGLILLETMPRGDDWVKRKAELALANEE